jgi:BirA family transcriptional regulator, biotin operon repressor / biotin---[acetyl-CoA-carboxylase] ligase
LPQPPFHNPLGSPFIELQSVDSTNNYARNLLHEARLPDRQGLVQHGLAIFAHEQVSGKGQRGKIWTSEKGSNIILSLVVKPLSLQLAQQFQLSVCAAVAVHGFLTKYAGEEVKIKWPNDLYWQDRKAGGILIESVIRSSETGDSSWEWSIIGIGINTNQTAFPIYLPNPVSLKQITGKSFDTVSLAKEICDGLNQKFSELIIDGFEKIYAQYLTHLYKINSAVKLKKDNRVFEAVIKGVTPGGRLIVYHSIEEEFEFGEVEWII